MLLNISQIGQIALPVVDVDRAEAFYEKVLGLRKLYRFRNLTFFDCAGVRLLLEKTRSPTGTLPASKRMTNGGRVPGGMKARARLT